MIQMGPVYEGRYLEAQDRIVCHQCARSASDIGTLVARPGEREATPCNDPAIDDEGTRAA